MNTSGDAAEQVIRLSLEGIEVMARLTGAGAKNLAILLYTVLKDADPQRTKGRTRLTSMLKTGKPLTVFTLNNADLEIFTKEAKHYGVLYCALGNPISRPDGVTDIMVKQEDAVRINRIVERFQLAAVDTAEIKSEILNEREGQETTKEALHTEEGYTEEPFLDDKFDIPEKQGETEQHPKEKSKSIRRETSYQEIPLVQAKNSPSGNSLKQHVLEGCRVAEKPSIRAELKTIKEKKEKNRVKQTPKIAEQPKKTMHRQPEKRRSSPKKQKGDNMR